MIPGRNAEPLVERPPPEASVPAGARSDEGSVPSPVQDPGAAPAAMAPPSELARQEPPAREPDMAAPSAAPAQLSAQATQPQEPGPAPGPQDMASSTQPADRAAGEAREPPGIPRAEPQATAAIRTGRRIGSGRATWYQHPGRTASGEKFNPNRFTAAHRTLPFGARVRVVREPTGRWVDVRINDRIPRGANAVIDLSRASARAIGISGVARVSLYRL